jgi:hypothetical protein
MCTADCGNPRRLNRGSPRIESLYCGLPQAEKYQFESGLPQAWPDRMYSWQPERGAWQSTVHLRAVCQGVIPVVAILGIWLRNLANDRIPVPAILHRLFPCFQRHTFLTREFVGVRKIRGGLCAPHARLMHASCTNGLSWQTISWYYPFKLLKISKR